LATVLKIDHDHEHEWNSYDGSGSEICSRNFAGREPGHIEDEGIDWLQTIEALLKLLRERRERESAHDLAADIKIDVEKRDADIETESSKGQGERTRPAIPAVASPDHSFGDLDVHQESDV
jgi:hypothetical protein